MKAERIVHDLIQSTPLWHKFRSEHHGASEAAAMLGLSPYMSRTELLKQKATGIVEEVSDIKQGLFDAGHEAEAKARPIAEGILGEDLYPSTYSFGKLSASVDGITMDELTAFEHKLWNADLAASVRRGELPEAYQPQCQQVMLVTGAEQVLFMVSDGTLENCVHMLVKPGPAWQKRIRAGWAQFEADLLDYKPVEVLPAAVATPTMQLPALSIQVTGSIALVDNLKVFGERLESFISGLNLKPADDQAFADAEAAIKTLGTAETALEAAKASALAQTASIDEMTRTVALYANQARNCRLMLTRLVKDRKESIRVEIVQGGKDALAKHIAGLHKRLGKPYAITPAADFGAAAKGKRTIASLRDACDTELAKAKIEANAMADRVSVNLNTLDEHGEGYAFLFADIVILALKDCDDFAALVKVRVSDHKAAEAKRLEAERERIRAEETAKLQREQEERDRKAKEQARAQEKMPDTKGDSSRTGNSAPGVVTSGNERPSGGLAPNPPAPVAARPTDDQIIDAICLAFRVHESKAIEWLLDMDLDGATERMVAQFEGRAA